MQLVRTALKWVLLMLVTWMIFRVAQGIAFDKRGCQAVGGEYMLLLMPALYIRTSENARATRAELKKEAEANET